MALELKDLDGQYRVTTVSDYHGPIPMKSDGITEIKNGRTQRVDQAGCQWSTCLTVLNDSEVRFESTADPGNAAADFLLTDEGGRLTHEPVTYTTTLKVARKEGKIRLSGNIQHGKILTVITMTKIDTP
ncbi:MAG: hypothetical protein HY052_09680 [Proteobacteria bacterium]|nr:hypothetical protein [Pseudomonadota bacterium]